MTEINLNSLPFDSEGRASLSYDAESRTPEENVFTKLGKTQRTTKPILIKYINYHTLAHGSAELPEAPIRTALNNNKAVVIYFVTDKGRVWATRLDNEGEIKHACIGKRFMPHFANAPAWARAANPDGFNMLIMRLHLEQFVQIDDFPDKHTKLTLERKTANSPNQTK